MCAHSESLVACKVLEELSVILGTVGYAGQRMGARAEIGRPGRIAAPGKVEARRAKSRHVGRSRGARADSQGTRSRSRFPSRVKVPGQRRGAPGSIEAPGQRQRAKAESGCRGWVEVRRPASSYARCSRGTEQSQGASAESRDCWHKRDETITTLTHTVFGHGDRLECTFTCTRVRFQRVDGSIVVPSSMPRLRGDTRHPVAESSSVPRLCTDIRCAA